MAPQKPLEFFVCWIVISKMIIVHEDGSLEDEEGNDYMALHVYPSTAGEGARVTGGHSLVKSTYSPSITSMTYLKLKTSEYVNTGKVLNLVLDQMDRTRDLYYNIRVFASVPFVNDRCR